MVVYVRMQVPCYTGVDDGGEVRLGRMSLYAMVVSEVLYCNSRRVLSNSSMC